MSHCKHMERWPDGICPACEAQEEIRRRQRQAQAFATVYGQLDFFARKHFVRVCGFWVADEDDETKTNSMTYENSLQTFLTNGMAAQRAVEAQLEQPRYQFDPSKPMTNHREIEIDKLFPSPTNPRKRFDETKLQELASTIKEHGVLEPLLVRAQANEFEIVAGERRWRASKLAGLTVLPCIVKELEDKQVLEIQYIENLQRDDLTALEEADGFARMIAEGMYTADSLSEKLGISRRTIFNRLKLARLKGPARLELERGNIPATIANLAAQLPTEKLQAAFVKSVLQGVGQDPLSFRQAEEELKQRYIRQLNGEFDQKAANLVKGCGTCEACPKRSGNIQGFEGGANVCTDLDCYAKKVKAAGVFRMKEAEAQGMKVIRAKEWDRLEYSGHYDRPNSHFYSWGSEANGKKWSALLGKDLPIALVETRSGAVEERVDVAKAKSLLESKGLLKRETRSLNPEDKAQREKSALEKRIAEAKAAALASAAEKQMHAGKIPLPMWRLLAKGAVQSSGYYRAEAIARRRGLKEKGARPEDSLSRAISDYNEPQCLALLTELFCDEKEAVEFLGIDLGNVIKGVRAESKSTKAAKAEPKRAKTLSAEARDRIAAMQRQKWAQNKAPARA